MKNTKKSTCVCAECSKNVTKTQYSILCNGDCKKYYHKSCSGLTNKEFDDYENKITDDKWICKKCSETSDKDNYPLTCTDESEILAMKNPSTKDILTFFARKFRQLEDSLDFKWKVIEDLNSKVQDIEKENNNIKKENDILKNRVKRMEDDLHYIKLKCNKEEIQERSKNIIIMGLPKEHDASENIEKVFKKLDINIKKDEYKIKPLESAGSQYPIKVTLENIEIKNKIMQRRRERRILSTRDCDIMGSDCKIYINEDLSKETRDLFFKAKELKSKGFKFVWCKYGKIFARKSEGSNVITISRSEQVETLIHQ